VFDLRGTAQASAYVPGGTSDHHARCLALRKGKTMADWEKACDGTMKRQEKK